MIFMSTTAYDKNTIQGNYTVQTRANTLRLLFNNPKLNNKILVILEGTSDTKIYSYLFDSTSVYLYENGSCDGIVQLLEDLNTDHADDCFVIKDADFDRLNDISYSTYANLFLTDTHDVETMMLKDDDTEAKLGCEFLNEQGMSFVRKCIDDLKVLSYIKWCNSSMNLHLNVHCIRVGSIYKGVREVQLSDCVDCLYKVPDNRLKCPDALQSISVFMTNHQTDDIWNLVNGHDLCTALAIYLSATAKATNLTGCKSISTDTVAQCIRMAYTMDKFKNTSLYTEIQGWASARQKQLFKL